MSLYKGKRQRQFPSKVGTTSFVKLYILHLVSEKSYYGNKIIDEIKYRMGDRWEPSPAMVYPLLRELEKEGYIKGSWDQPEKRSIKRYRITDTGKDHYKVILRQYKSSFEDSLYIVKSVLNDIYKQNL